MRTLSFAIAAAVVFAFAPPTQAADCTGDPGLTLDVQPGDVPIGTLFDLSISAPAGSTVVLLLSTAPGPTPTPFGDICVGAPLSAFAFVMPSPSIAFNHFMGCFPDFVGLSAYFQFIAFHPMLPGGFGRSNPAMINFIDGDCNLKPPPGSFVTYTQGGWGTSCKGNNPGCLRDANFATALPNGVILGDADGPDGDAFFAAKFETSAAVEAFLPAGGTPNPLAADATNPTTTAAGVFAGQLLSAKLSVGFDDAGVFDAKKSDPSIKLADLVFIANVNPALFGVTVADVIALADAVISGEQTAPVDVNGMSVGIGDLNTALDKLNNNFDGGNVALGTLGVFHDAP